MAKTDRVDSGFGESLTNLIEMKDSSDVSTMISHPPKASQSSEQRESKAITTPGELPQSAYSKSTNRPTVPQSTRPKTSQRIQSRRGSGTPGSLQGSNPSSRRSSFVTPQSIVSYNKRPSATHRSATIAYDKRQCEDPFVLHRRSTQIFQSLEPSPNSRSRNSIDAERRLTSPSLPDLSLLSSTITATEQGLPTHQVDGADSILRYQYDNHVPATVIDWTLPSTRRQEYREIDKSCQGIRGLWRRLVPRRFRGNSRLSFFNDDDSDTGSVRRYRLDLPDEEEEKKGEIIGVKEQELRPESNNTKRKWGCRRFRDRFQQSS